MAKSAPARPRASQRAAPSAPPSAPSKALQVFANPAPGRDYAIQFQIPEFTCLCPLTGQPDFAHLTIDMVADAWCVELKSLKMYVWSFRNEGAFHEKVTNDIVEALALATRPRFVRLTAKWYVRGGIYTNVVAEYRKKGWKPAPPLLMPTHAASGGLL
jgi:7-cyano-7-deazaguanine reductase